MKRIDVNAETGEAREIEMSPDEIAAFEASRASFAQALAQATPPMTETDESGDAIFAAAVN